MKMNVRKAAIAAIAATSLAVGTADARDVDRNLVDTAASAGQFNILVTAIKTAGLADTLKSSGPFTVFAPTDAAFAKLPAGTMKTLLKPENKAQLTAILTYHVVPGTVMAADVAKLKQAKTLNGQMISVKANGGAVAINDAKVTDADIRASNGVIHVIDTVMLPPSG